MMNLTNRIRNEKGFTLVELMAVLALLALLLAIAIPAIGSIIEKSKASADESSIALMEEAGENAYVDDRIDFDGPEPESYTIPTLIEEGYLKLDEDDKFNQPENYVTKKNIGGEFIWMGDGRLADDEAADAPYVAMNCEEAEAQGYTCIYNEDELNDVRNELDGKFILMNDIDVSAYSPWTPIGDSTGGFSGELNGNGYKITNLVIDQAASEAAGYTDANFGLFGTVVAGTYQNIVIDDYSQAVSDTVNAAALIGYVDSMASTNPEAAPLVIQNVDISGEATHSGSSGGRIASLVGYLYSEVSDLTINDITYSGKILSTNTASYRNMVSGLIGELDMVDSPTDRQMTVGISNIELNAVDLNGVSMVVGLVNILDLENTDAVVTLSGVTIDGKLESADAVAGLVGQLNAESATYAYVIEDVNMAAALHSRGLSSWPVAVGLVEDVYADVAEGSTRIENIAISGPMTIANPNDKSAAIAGLITYHNTWDTTENFVVKNVAISSSMIGDGKTSVSGFMDNYNPNWSDLPNKSTHSFSDITISGQMTGKAVAGMFNNFNPYGLNLELTVDNIDISGNMMGLDTTGLVYNYNPAYATLNQQFTNIEVNSNMVATRMASGLIDTYNSYTEDEHELDLVFSGIQVNGDMSGVYVAGVMYGFWPDNGQTTMRFLDIGVNGTLSGTEVAGFANEFDPNNTYSQDYANTFVLDGFTFTGEMRGVDIAAGLFGAWNNDTTDYEYYSGLYDVLEYTIQNVNLDGTVTVSNGATGVYGELIGKVVAPEKRSNTYLFKDIQLSNDLTVTGETAGFKNGIVAEYPATGHPELIFENVQ